MKLISVLFLLLSSTAMAALPFKGQGVKTLAGKDISTLKSGKKGTVVFFVSSTCPCSNSHLSHFKELESKFKDFSFIAVHSDKDAEVAKAKKHFDSKGLNFPVLNDKKQVIADELEATKTPHTFVYNTKSELVFHGGVSNSSIFDNASKFYLKDALTNLNAGKKPKMAFARALGCYIGRD